MAGRLHAAGHVILATVFVLLVTSRFVAAAADSPIRIGLSAGFTGPTRAMAVELYRGALACLEQRNRAGGVDGRPLELLAADDGYEPDPAIENTVRFLIDDKVVALFSQLGAPTVSRILPVLRAYADQRGRLFFPVTGLEATREAPNTHFVYNLRASYRQEIEALVNAFVRKGLTRIALGYQADAFGRSGWDGAGLALGRRGMNLRGEATFARAATVTADMTAQARILAAADPQAILIIGAAPGCAALIRDIRRMGLTTPVGVVSFAGGELLLTLLETEGAEHGLDLEGNLLLSQVTPGWRDSTLPAAREYRQALAGLATCPPPPGGWSRTQPEGSAIGFEGFLNAKLLLAVLSAMPDPCDRRYLDEAVAAIGQVDLGIGTPVSLTGPDHQGLDHVYLFTAKKGRLIPQNASAATDGE